MPTGDKRSNIYNKRNMPEEAWNLHFFRFLDDKINDTTRAAFLQSGVLDDDTIGITGPAADVFKLDISNADRVIDGFGHIIDLTAYIAATGVADVRSFFENALAVEYYVGIRYQEKADDVERNPSSSEPEYPWYQDLIGEMGAPDNVADNSTSIRLEIDGVLENGVDHSQRPITVWLNNPVSPDDSIAYYTGVVAYAAGINYVDIPYSPGAGPLGQTTPEFSISLSALDYAVFIPGVSWFRNTDISTDENYAFIGKVTGAGAGNPPTIFDISGQRPVFLISLDRAYRGNSTDDPAIGRTIFADSKAVRIKQSATSTGTEDWINEALRIDQLDQGGAFISRGATVVGGYHGGTTGRQVGWSHYMNLSDGVGADLQVSEAFTALVGVATVVLSRGAINLLAFTDLFNAHQCVVQISGTTNGTFDGYFYITGTPLVDRFDLEYADGSALSFAAGIGGDIRIIAPLSTSLIGDWVMGTPAYTTDASYYWAFPNYGNGAILNTSGDPVDPGRSFYLSFRNSENSEQNRFAEMYYGRFLMRGGGDSYIGYNWRDEIVSGHAQITVDKLDVRHFSTDHIPAEASQEWGFDYRGAHFGKSTADDIPGYQMGSSFRLPMWWYDSATDEYLIEENITYFSATTLNFTSGTFDNTNMPFDVNVFPNGVLAEIEFDAPDEADSGVYFAYDKPTIARIQFKKLDGTDPTFTAAATGKARLYGGVFQGTVDTSNMGVMNDAFMMNVTSPNMKTGGLRYTHRANNAIGSTDLLYALWFANVASPMFSVRDGGVVFGRAITTKSPSAVGNLTQWDQIDSSLYTGDLTKFDEIELNESTNEISLPVALASCNIVKQKGGGSWAPQRHINIFKVITGETGGTPHWYSPASTNYVQATANNEIGKIPFILPQGAVLNSVSFYVDPTTGDGTGASFGVEVIRKGFNVTTRDSLQSGGANFASTATVHIMTTTVNQNNTIANESYTYWIDIQSSTVAANDLVYTCRANYTIDNLGENWFDCF